MDNRIRNADLYGEIYLVSVVPDAARQLKVELEHKGYKVSIATDHETQTLPLANDAILKVTSADNVDLLAPEQQRNSASPIIGQQRSQIPIARDELRGDYREIIGKSPQIFEVLQQIENIADTPLRVLISGETGTGKGVVARALHKNSGRSGEMVSVNCAAIPENLLESELFGHERGAFTSADARHIGKFERAHRGTLFLDEIAEMPLSMQPKLLRAIEDGEIERVGGKKPITVDVRIVAATNRYLAQSVKDKTFREDLYYRLKVTAISLPTLSERREDIDLLVAHFLEKHCRLGESEIPQVAPSARALLRGYSWPGNVRELENAIERASCLTKDGILLPEHLPEEIQMYQYQPVNIARNQSVPENEQAVNIPLGITLEAMEETVICETLAWLKGNRTKTAKILGIGIRTLQRKIKKYGV